MNTTTLEDKQTLILQTTLDLVSERGLHNTPISLIARQSGVSVGIIYHYFAGKDDLLAALHRAVKRRWGEAVMRSNPQEQEDWRTRLTRIWLDAFHFYATHPKETLFLEQYENLPHQIDELTEDIDPNLARLLHLVQADMERGDILTLPMYALYDMTLGVALALAKRQIAGTLKLDEATLALIAQSCCCAIAR